MGSNNIKPSRNTRAVIVQVTGGGLRNFLLVVKLLQFTVNIKAFQLVDQIVTILAILKWIG